MQPANLEKVRVRIRKAAQTGMDTGMLIDVEDLGGRWQEQIKGLGTFIGGAYISRGFADACLAILECTGGFEVGTGEALRPYLQHYRGKNEAIAVTQFLNQAEEFTPITG